MRSIILSSIICSVLFISCTGDSNKTIVEEEGENTSTPVNPVTPDNVEFKSSDNGAEIVRYPQIVFDQESMDIGEMIDGEIKQFKFGFTNKGNADLIIKSANGSCGCTVPEPPKEPIPPGEKGYISVEFNSSGRGPGEGGTQGVVNEKNITVWTNCMEPQKVINFRALVNPK